MSDLEDLLYSQIMDANLPEPVREHRFAKEVMGRQWRWDFAFIDHMLAVEVDGGGWSGGRHTTGSGFAKDMDKHNSGTLLGWMLIRVSAKHIKSGEALSMIKTLLERQESK